MTRDPRPPVDLDDDTIAQLVRDVADGWSMPPQRLDTPSWRDRVRSRRARRIESARGWFGRVGQAATAAVALTVVAALVAVVLTRSPGPVGSTPAPSFGGSSGATKAPQASILPKLVLDGELPSVTDVVVVTEDDNLARVDLSKGSISQATTGGHFGSAWHTEADGSVLCLCVAASVNVGGSPTVIAVRLDRYDRKGALLATTPIESFTGTPDPRDAGTFVPDQPAHVGTSVSFSDDGRFGFVGWSLRAHPVWHNGMLVVDLRDGSILSRLGLPDATTGPETARRMVAAPKVIGAAGDGKLFIARPWYEWTPPTAPEPTYTFDNDLFHVGFSDGKWLDAAPVPLQADCGADAFLGGPLAGGATWIACSTGGTELTVIRRLAADGSLIGDVRVVGLGAVDGTLVTPSPDGRAVFVWDPVSATITRVDLATGTTTVGHGTTASTGAGPLAALGDWLAPTAAAKSLLRGGLVMAPDGSRVYAIGINSGTSSDGSPTSGSAGVFAFDPTTLALVAKCPATADFVSLAVSRDGRFVYAAGLPGVDAAGKDSAAQGASITVFSTADGSVRLVAGELGFAMLSFASPVLD